MSEVDVQIKGVIKPKYDKRRKGYKYTHDGMEIFIKGEDEEAVLKKMSDLIESDKENETHSFAEGGMEDGGLKDEGGTVDPVSGNDVPVGSTQKEVRDDIPAQLSEGEFVFPADVTRYIGLENLMELRNKAKKGLAQMDAMGQMGNSEEATMDDTAEMDVDIDAMIDEFDPNSPETMQFAMGGVVKAYTGAVIPGQMPPQQFSYGYQPQPQQVGYAPPQVPQGQFPDYSKFVSQPAKQAAGQEKGITEQRQYIGPNGEMITIMFIDGVPQQEVPKDYKVYKPEEVKPEIAAPVVQQQDDGGDGPEDTKSTEPTFGFGSYRSMEDMSNIFSTINTDLANLKATQKNKKQSPFLAVEIFNKVVDGVKEGYYTNKAVDQVRSGENLSTKPEGEYADWRQDMSTFMAAATLETENEAKDVSSKNRDIRGSSFASRKEANAVANNGWGSDAHFDAIDDQYQDLQTADNRDGSGFTSGSDAANVDSGRGGMGPSGSGPSRDDDNDPYGGQEGTQDDKGNFGFSKGGAVQQTKRALKSSRKK